MKNLVRYAAPLFFLIAAPLCAQTIEEIEKAAERMKLDGQVVTVMRQTVPKPRTDAPIPIELELEYRSDKILRGRIEAELVYGEQVVARLRSPEVVLSKDKRIERFTLPILRVQQQGDLIQLRLSFDAEDRRIELDPQSISVPTPRPRQLVIGVTESSSQSDVSGGELLLSLLLEKRKADEKDNTMLTLPARIEAARLPIQPAHYFAYDMLVLTREGFAQASEPALQAIGLWVKAGGSVLVLAGEGLEERHTVFLNTLADGAAHAALGPNGQWLLNDDAPPAGVAHWFPGLGRAAVTFDPGGVESLAGGETWIETVCHLWKVRAQQVGEIRANGKWNDKLVEQARNEIRYDYYGNPNANYDALKGSIALPMHKSGEIVRTLMPSNVQVIDFWVIVLILALFTLAVGPADYIVLGVLRQRKLTWVLFPCIAIAFTLTTVAVAERYMGRTDRRRSISFIDVGADGGVLRKSSLELSFLARERTVTDEVDSELLLPVHMEMLAEAYDYERRMMGGGYDTQREQRTGPPTFIGRVPDNYELQRRIFQWQADVARRTGIPDAQSPASRPTHAIQWPAGDAKGQEVKLDEVLTGLPAGSVALIYRGTSFRAYNSQTRAVIDATLSGQENFKLLEGDAAPTGGLLRQFCVRQGEGLFSIVSQVSPTGGETFEDLSILDPTDNSQWLMVVVVPVDDDYLIYRRLYRSTP